jgi:DNA (cytosine-5)-methyltransferase 1
LKSKLKHIELFAGCGGLTLGLERAGFDLLFANEVSPMASATFAHNILNLDISKPHENIKWIHSRYSRDHIEKRTREDLLTHGKLEQSEIDFKSDLASIKNTLLIGDLRLMNNALTKSKINDPYNGELDLISGGPPCQSFSLAGKREKENYKNRLPLDFAEICQLLNPKLVLLENVKGITSAFKEDNKKYYAWFEVAKTFTSKGYVPVCMMINSKYFGVPQNRPRYIMIAIRSDLFDILHAKNPKHPVLLDLKKYLTKAKRGINDISVTDLKYYDAIKDFENFDGFILPKLSSQEANSWISVEDAIEDLSSSRKPSKYVAELNTLFQSSRNTHQNIVKNHNYRSHTSTTKSRFLFYQLLSTSSDLEKEILKCKSKGEPIKQSISSQLFELLPEKQKPFNSQKELHLFLNSITLTKKHSQRALIASKPAPAQLTIPDDICHYSLAQNRVLSVREMARIQSFPDWFEFKAKETTGGKNRRYEVPQYTQVGNAVPPKLGYELGLHLKSLLKEIMYELQ